MGNKQLHKLLLLFALSVLFALPLNALSKLNYLKYETKFLTLYFSEELDLREIAFIIEEAERSERFLHALYGWSPKKRIPAVFDRETDMANGWSRPFMKQKIFLYIFPPEEFSTLMHYKSFEAQLIVHELTHALQTGMTKGIPSIINLLFGDLYFPAQLAPGWLLEGAAVYSESLLDDAGRMTSPLYRSWFTSFFSKGNVLRIDQLSGIPDHWIGGHAEYLYGIYFYDFIMQRHGPRAMTHFFSELADNIIPYMAGFEAQHVFGERFSVLYDLFVDENRKELYARNEKPNGMYDSGERFESMTVDPAAPGYLFIGRRSGSRALFSYNGMKTEKIYTVPDTDSFAYTGDTLVLPVSLYEDDRVSRNELFVIARDSWEVKKITTGETAAYPVITKDHILYVSYKGGINRIKTISFDGKELSEHELPGFDSIIGPVYSANGKKLLFTGNIRKRDKNLFLMDLSTKNITEIKLPGIQASASFDPGGNILFSSTDGDRFIIQRINLHTKTLETLLTPEFSAIYPRIVDGRLYFTGFDNDGYFPAWHPLSIIAQTSIEPDTIAALDPKEGVPQPAQGLKPSPWYDGLLPSLLMPDYNAGLNGQKLGFTLYAESDTSRRAWSLYGGKTFDASEKWEGSLHYSDSDIMPSFQADLRGVWYIRSFQDSGKRQRKAEVLSLSASIFTQRYFNRVIRIGPWIFKTDESISASLGLRGFSETPRNTLDDPLSYPLEGRRGETLSFGASYGFYFSFNPGSYLLFSNMEAGGLHLGFSFDTELERLEPSITLSPSLTVSKLIDSAGKLGFITRWQLYSILLRDAAFGLGGDEKSEDFKSVDRFIYGGGNSVSVRGYPANALYGPTVWYTNNELRFHLFSIEHGIGILPIMLKNLQGSVFVDLGGASGDWNLFDDPFIAGAGGELKLLTNFWYKVPVMFTFGISRGLTKNGITNIYFSFGNSF